jgi:probable HAF family extracellular repeat protein
MVAMGGPPPGGFGHIGSYFRAASVDGSVLVGYGLWNVGVRATRWTAGDGWTSLGTLAGYSSSEAYGTSADGSVIVGVASGAPGLQAFRWTAAAGMIGLGDLPLGTFGSHATDVSADGAVIVGNGQSAVSFEAFRWTQGGGMVGLGFLDPLAANRLSQAGGISADGNVIVGLASNPAGSGYVAFRWTQAGGMQNLGDLPGGTTYAAANCVSADGSIIAGGATSALGDESFVWTAATGMRSLRQMLIDGGANLSGWGPLYVSEMSDDGKVLVGQGLNPSGNYEAFAAYIPEPSAAALGLTGLGLPLLFSRHRQRCRARGHRRVVRIA